MRERRNVTSLSWLLASLLLASGLVGCKDSGEASFEAGKAAYERAVQAQASPDSKAFDEALEALAKVPDDSRRVAQARALQEAIQRARGKMVRRALAPAQSGQREEDVAAQLKECVLLAQRLGETPVGSARDAVRSDLDACQKKAEALNALHSPSSSSHQP